MVPYQWRDDANQSMMMILEPRLVAPISGHDVTSECGRWRNVTNMPLQHDLWTEQWTKSTCHHQLMQNGTWAVTMYSQSWGDGLKCWLRYRDKKMAAKYLSSIYDAQLFIFGERVSIVDGNA